MFIALQLHVNKALLATYFVAATMAIAYRPTIYFQFWREYK